MHPRRLFLLLALLALAAPTGAAEIDPAAPLPVDPAVQMRELPNGMQMWLRQHSTPPNRLGIWLHVGSGSLNEADEQRGLAHFLEHMAFNGSEHFPPGELIKYFESIGMRFGPHQNAFTSYNQTTYTLTLPDTEPATIADGMLCMADYAFRLLLLEEEVAKEKGVVLEEIRARKGARQRIIEELLPILLPGSRVAERLPIGKEEVIRDLSAQKVREYYEKWYRPGNTTLVAVGDVDAAVVASAAAGQFAQWQPAADPPSDAEPGIRPYDSLRAAVLTDPEATEAEVSVVSVRPLEPFGTVGDFRRTLVDEFANWVVNRRMSEMIQKGTAPFQEAQVGKGPFLNACTYIDAAASGRPDAWRAMMRSLLRELKRAREHGFLDQELSNARKAIIASAEHAARTENTRDQRSLLSEMNSTVAQGRKPISAQQRLDLIRQCIEGITPGEAADAFRANFDPQARLLLVIMPEKEGLDVPTESEILAVAREVTGAQVSPPEPKVEREQLLDREPAQGEVQAREEEPDLGVLSVAFQNGVRAHLRSVDFKEDQVFIKVTVGGGILQEGPANRGMTGAAALVVGQPASDDLSSTEIRDLLTGKTVSLSGGPSQDAMAFNLTCATRDAEEAMRLVHLLLTRPHVEQSAVDRWRDEMLQAIARRRIDVEDQAMEALQAMLSGGDSRLRFPSEGQVRSITRAQAQAWLEGIVREGPIEAAIVGDIERERALDLALRYLASLPPRPFDQPALDNLRHVDYESGPLSHTVEVDTVTARAVVLAGWRGADWSAVKDRRILQIAAEILNPRLRESIREERGLTYSIFCFARAAEAYPGTGMLMVWFTADPEKAAQAAGLVREEVERFAREGPTDEEMATVRKQFAKSIETSQQEPSYWVNVLGELEYRGTVLQDVKTAMEAYTSYTREELTEVVGRYVTPQRRLQVIALPAAAERPDSQPNIAPTAK